MIKCYKTTGVCNEKDSCYGDVCAGLAGNGNE